MKLKKFFKVLLFGWLIFLTSCNSINNYKKELINEGYQVMNYKLTKKEQTNYEDSLYGIKEILFGTKVDENQIYIVFIGKFNTKENATNVYNFCLTQLNDECSLVQNKKIIIFKIQRQKNTASNKLN